MNVGHARLGTPGPGTQAPPYAGNVSGSDQLEFVAPGASEADRERGLAAALLYLEHAGVSVDRALTGAQARMDWGDSGLAPLLEPSQPDLTGAEALDGALEAALRACYRGRNAPLEAELRRSPSNPDPASSGSGAP